MIRLGCAELVAGFILQESVSMDGVLAQPFESNKTEVAPIITLRPWMYTCLGDLELGLIKSGFAISQPISRISTKEHQSIASYALART